MRDTVMNVSPMIVLDQIPSDFISRHIGPTGEDIEHMLATIGASSMETLISETVPAPIRMKGTLNLNRGLSEAAAVQVVKSLAKKNKVFTSLIGQGYHGTVTPAVILRNVLENPGWYTAYTPYQPEISQGRLEAIINFQTMIADLTGLEVANASLLDEATAAAEAMAVAHRSARNKNSVFFVSKDTHPQTIAVIKTRAEPLGWQVVVGDPDVDLKPSEVFGALFQYPGTTGRICDHSSSIGQIKEAGGIAVVSADLLALTLLVPPGELGADIAIGSAQRFGVPMGFGGPHAAYMACKGEFTRSLPGRLVGVSIDARGNNAYRLTLQTREQHIRREKATSNICTAQVLLAVMASMYGVYHGPEGLKKIANEVHRKAAVLVAGLNLIGYSPVNSTYFDTVTVDVSGRQDEIVAKARAQNINLRSIDQTFVSIALDETVTADTIEAVWRSFGGSLTYEAMNTITEFGIPQHLRRTSNFMSHPTFHRYHTETEMLRYIRKLSDRDLALDRAMIPLGSCTMKLNATSEMIPITWPEFADIHPFAPRDQTEGYLELINLFEQWLCEITGYDAVSLQPNSGAQGEYAGLLAIRAYHRSRGESHRNICLIPSSAHGTNPASAQMVGMDVVVVRCDDGGNVDMDDLRQKAHQHSARLAAVMVTYPSTHGVFEEQIRELCDIIHDTGGQVYLDGANLNAQVGLSKPGEYGADVSHLNLHKTFCIPHGGGGPGVGPIGVKSHLAPFLPGHQSLDNGHSIVGPVAAAAYGSAAILPISFTYILMMGSDGLRRATEVAILSANYIAQRLDPHFPVLYRNEKGRVAHECIVDPRALKDLYGVTVDDIAKRLVDYGFHAPTMSFPVPGTLMIEPTESESKREIDRFIDAMIAIRGEVRQIEQGVLDVKDSPLRHAPHTVLDISKDNWGRKYSRADGCFPAGQSHLDKYWSPVNRVDNAFGDRNIMCSCPPIEGIGNN